VIPGAGASGGNLVTTIASVTNSTTLVLNAPAGATLAGVHASIAWGTDDTKAIQAHADTLIAPNPISLVFPSRYYLINKFPITIPFGGGWCISGLGRRATQIIQAADDTPIFQFQGAGTWGFEICDIGFVAAAPQPATNLNSVGIQFSPTATPPPTSSFFNFHLNRLDFLNLAVCVGGDTMKAFAVWGMHIDGLTAQAISLSVVSLKPTSIVGQPNNTFNNVYLLAQTTVGPIFDLSACPQTAMNGIEIDNADLGAPQCSQLKPSANRISC
jgi:hypothetical protein